MAYLSFYPLLLFMSRDLDTDTSNFFLFMEIKVPKELNIWRV